MTKKVQFISEAAPLENIMVEKICDASIILWKWMKNHFSLGRQKAQLLVCVHVLEMAAFSQFTGALDNKSNISRPFIIDNLECRLFIFCPLRWIVSINLTNRERILWKRWFCLLTTQKCEQNKSHHEEDDWQFLKLES